MSSCIYNYEIGELFTPTGTAQANGGVLTQVDGVGTAFLTEFAAGYLVTINNETRVVASVSNDTTMVVDAAFSSSVPTAAFTGVNLVNLESLTVSVFPPNGRPYIEFSKLLQLGDGTVRGAGWAKMQWAWGYLLDTQRDQLRLFCDDGSGNPVASNEVYIRTRTNETQGEYKRYSCVLVWPTGREQFSADKAINFSLAFQRLIEVTVV